MRSLICLQPQVLAYQTIAPPVPVVGRSIVKIKRIGVCGTDIHAFGGTQPYFTYPRILGHELGCEFVEGDAEGFEPGEAVSVIPYEHCGACVACRQGKTNCCQHLKVIGVHADGGMVEYLSVPSQNLLKGGGLDFNDLALVEPLSVSAHGVRRAEIQAGEWVLVMGAGPIGLGAIAFAKAAGAKVAALDTNVLRLDFCKIKLGVDATLNPKEADPMEALRDLTNGDMPTVVIDATGNLNAINTGFQYMAHTARYVLIGLQREAISVVHPEFHKREGTLMSSRNATRADFEYVIECIQKGTIVPSWFVTHRLSFDDAKDAFSTLLQTGEVIKALIEL